MPSEDSSDANLLRGGIPLELWAKQSTLTTEPKRVSLLSVF
jgi:hypothetical protein